MARYINASCRLCRREGVKLYLKGDRCYTEKCSFSRREYAPGQHGQQKKKGSEYSIQLREKQKARRYYGVLEKQFKNYFKMAEKVKGITGDNLLRILESRLDNVIYRLGLAESRAQARQLVRHGHFMINGNKVDIPSYLLKLNDTITIKEKSKNSIKIKKLIEDSTSRTLPNWLEFNVKDLIGRVISIPKREDVDLPLKEYLIVELYSK